MIKRAVVLVMLAELLLYGELSLGLTLNESIQHTIATNPDILRSVNDRKAVGQEIDQARGGYFPTVDLNLGIGWERTSNPTTRARGEGSVDMRREEAGILVRQMLFDGFATPSEVNRQSARTNSRVHSVYGESENISLRAIETYLDVLRRQDLVNLSKANLELHERTNDQIRLRSERGVGRKADEDQSRGRLSLAHTNYEAEQGNLRDAKTNFLRVIGIFPDKLVKPEKSTFDLPASLNHAKKMAIHNHPTLKSAESDVESAKAQHRTAKSPYFPRFDLEVGATRNYNLDGIRGTNEDISAMLRMRYNLFRGGRDKARRSETAHLIDAAKEIRNLTRRQVEESIRLSWNAQKTVSRQLESFRRFSDAAEKTYKAYQQQFNIGQRTLLDLLDAANEMFVAKSDYTNAQYDELFARFRILASIGILNRTLEIELPEEATNLVKVYSGDE